MRERLFGMCCSSGFVGGAFTLSFKLQERGKVRLRSTKISVKNKFTFFDEQLTASQDLLRLCAFFLVFCVPFY